MSENKKINAAVGRDNIITGDSIIISGSYEEILSHTSIRLLSTAEQPELIRSAASVPVVGNVYAVFNYELYMKEDEETDKTEVASFYIKEDQLKDWGITADKFYKDVLKTSAANRDRAAEISSIEDVISLGDDDSNRTFYVLTNIHRMFGASAMLQQDVLKEFAEKSGGGFYIIPSSVHEVLLVPESLGILPSELKEMLTDVNSSIVKPEEILDEDIYHYSEADGLTVAA